jgi:hypothetical protein
MNETTREALRRAAEKAAFFSLIISDVLAGRIWASYSQMIDAKTELEEALENIPD